MNNPIVKSLLRSLGAASLLLTLVPIAPVAARVAEASGRPCGRIIFSALSPRGTALKSVKRDGTGMKKIAERRFAFESFEVSPDGRSIAYWGPDFDLWLIRSDGSGNRKLTETDSSNDAGISWSPDSRKVASTTGDGEREVVVVDVATGEVSTIARGQEPHFSSDGSSLVFAAPSNEAGDETRDLFVVNLESGATSAITDDPSSDDDTPQWSPDGAWIVFNRFPVSQSYEQDGYSDLWRVSPTGGDLKQLTDVQDDTYGVSKGRWSPNARVIAYSTESYDDDNRLRVIDVAGQSHTKRFFGERGQSGTDVSWAPSGRQIIFQRFKRHWDIWKRNLASGAVKNLTRSKNYEWNPRYVPCSTKV